MGEHARQKETSPDIDRTSYVEVASVCLLLHHHPFSVVSVLLLVSGFISSVPCRLHRLYLTSFPVHRKIDELIAVMREGRQNIGKARKTGRAAEMRNRNG